MVQEAVDEEALPLHVPVPPTNIGQGCQPHNGTVLKIVNLVLLRLVEGTCDDLGVAEGRNLLGQAEIGTAEDFLGGQLAVKGFLGVARHEATLTKNSSDLKENCKNYSLYRTTLVSALYRYQATPKLSNA